MSFDAEVRAFVLKTEAVTKNVLVDVAVAVKGSIVDGSVITGAPGQPVDTGALRASWILSYPSATMAEISTNLVYAPIIEDGVRSLRGKRGDAGVSKGGSTLALTLRSQVGGWHSVRYTVAGFQRLVEAVVAKVRV